MASNLFTIFEEPGRASHDDSHRVRKLSHTSGRKHPLRSCLIDRLPDELMFEILSYVPPDCHGVYQTGKLVECFPIPLVSKKWRRVYDRVLFRKIDLRSHLENKPKRIADLLEMLRKKPEVRSYVKSFSIKLSGDSENGMAMENLCRVVSICPAVCRVALSGSIMEPQRVLIRTVLSLQLLETLAMPYAVFKLIDQKINLPHLKQLRLYRLGIAPDAPGQNPPRDWSGRGQAVAVDFTHSAPLLENLDNILPINMYNCPALTSLELSDANSTTLSVSEYILQWPTNLTHLALTWFPDSHNGWKFSQDSVERYINVHRSTLKHLEIGHFYGGRQSIPDFSSFPQLEELVISAFNVVQLLSPSQVLQNLAAPKLRTVTFPYHTDSRQRRDGTRFTGEHLKWFREFAQEKLLGSIDSQLEKIVVKYDIHISPEEVFLLRQNDRRYAQTEIDWPWEYVIRAQKVMKKYGLNLEYEARWSREEWNDIVRGRAEAPDIFDETQLELGDLFCEN